jgi:hypothetical protein
MQPLRGHWWRLTVIGQADGLPLRREQFEEFFIEAHLQGPGESTNSAASERYHFQESTLIVEHVGSVAPKNQLHLCSLMNLVDGRISWHRIYST